MKLKVGDKAPDFSTNDQDGKVVNLSALRGKKVVLYFYPKDMTPGCTAEACNLRDNYQLLLRKGYEVFGVSTDNEKSHQKFITKEKLPFRLLADTDKLLHDAYGTWVEKSMYGRKYMGTLRVTFIINESGVIEDIIEKVDTRNHTDQILKTDEVAQSTSAPRKKPAKAAKKTLTMAGKKAPSKKK
jgi:thioredoxin-dependent peroxiredoxin